MNSNIGLKKVMFETVQSKPSTLAVLHFYDNCTPYSLPSFF